MSRFCTIPTTSLTHYVWFTTGTQATGASDEVQRRAARDGKAFNAEKAVRFFFK